MMWKTAGVSGATGFLWFGDIYPLRIYRGLREECQGIRKIGSVEGDYERSRTFVTESCDPTEAGVTNRLPRGYGYVAIRFLGVGSEPSRDSGIVSFSRANLHLFSRFSRFDCDFSIAAIRHEICGLIRNSVRAAQLLAYFDESFRHVLGTEGEEHLPPGLFRQLAEI